MNIPKKYFYTIGDVCKLTGTKPHILRYWESQFKLLKPARRYSGHRKYTQHEVDVINKIHFLIIDRKFTLAGAKKEIARQYTEKQTVNKEAAPVGAPQTQPANMDMLRDIQKHIQDCLTILKPAPRQQELISL